jgi:anaphase-promoting complex subunit 2
MKMPGMTVNAQQRRVFDSVFGNVSISQPTPVATPATGFILSGQAFGVPPPASHRNLPMPLSEIRDPPPSRGISSFISNHVDDQVRWDRSWHLVTHHLHLPNFPENRGVLEPLKPERESLGAEFFDALEDVLYPQDYVPLARQTEDIVAWHTSQVRQHFLQQVLPIILRLENQPDPGVLIIRGVKILETAHRQYLHGLSFIKEQMDTSAPETSQPAVAKFRRDLHAVINNSAIDPLSAALKSILRWNVSTILGLQSNDELDSHNIAAESQESEKARREMLGLVDSLTKVGLTGERFQVTFAEIMNDSMTEYVHRGCKGLWSPGDKAVTPQLKNQLSSVANPSSFLPRTAHHSSPSRCVTDLCEWIENRYAKLAVQVLSILDTNIKVSWTDMEKFKEMSIDRLANLRINELFDIVVNWPGSSGALDDLRTAITTAQKRLHLTDVFAYALDRNLLHPGASTILILQTYISMIRSFHALDHSKVLLDRVAYALQLYLCSREDTVRIIIAGLLSDTEDHQGKLIGPAGDKLVELARLLNDSSEKVGHRANDEELDWHDLEWIPNPVDAGPGYKRSKTADIIGTLIGVLGSPEVFIKEFQNIIGENFLKHDAVFEKEVSRYTSRSHYKSLTSIDQSSGAIKEQIWRSASTSLRGHAQGHSRLGKGQWCSQEEPKPGPK